MKKRGCSVTNFSKLALCVDSLPFFPLRANPAYYTSELLLPTHPWRISLHHILVLVHLPWFAPHFVLLVSALICLESFLRECASIGTYAGLVSPTVNSFVLFSASPLPTFLPSTPADSPALPQGTRCLLCQGWTVTPQLPLLRYL